MYDVEKRSAVLENAAGFARLDAYVRILSCNKMVALGYVFTLGNKLRVPPNAVQVKMPPALVS